ncbi:DNA repair protein RecN [Lentilactobacillus sp. SPB1-3]|uniref:DNA repair protein RecN n=1 Tax=Lentilactobacillus terminaliae TaxID=3003483 RepID=A0ACD5DCC2_9LACO|nr:DNA repair protein RecN [Lentilactobacillus sp. SPB1-3]MCZ0977161.1 DNA repair protein RecN [Lentilactobacillus sp. SPB1-3]
MLLELSITDFAIIEHLDVDFQSGMTVLTGETGAGKSIIIDAVSLLAGSRGSKDFIRTGAKKAIIAGNFVLDESNPTYGLLDDLEIDHDDGSVVIERELFESGRNSCRVNGRLVNISTLRRIGETIVDIQGQNDHQELMNPERHISLLDEFGETELTDLLTEYRSEYSNYLKLKTASAEKSQNEKAWAQRLDMLKFQINEIDSAELSSGEEEELIAQRDRLNNFQRIHDALVTSYESLNSDESSSLDGVGTAMSSMQAIDDLDPDFHQISEDISGAFYALQDAVNSLSDQISTLEFNQNTLDEVEQRLNLINQLEKKYGDTLSQVLEYRKTIGDELEQMQGSAAEDSDLAERLEASRQQLVAMAKTISNKRLAVAVELKNGVQHQLADLYMEKAVFEVHIEPTKELTRNGMDAVEFFIQTNPGEKLLPLVKSASGGELSRIMLALKTIFAKAVGVTSIIFDEVDTGVSGRVAQAIANKIYTISAKSQVLCITHLPQVAAMSDQHYFISKQVSGDRTMTHLQELDKNDSINELSRMLAGTEVTKITREHAEELLKLASHEKEVIRKNLK